MDRNRRRFLAGTTLMGVSQVAGIGWGGELAEPAGRRPVTRQELDQLQKEQSGGHFTCIRTPESTDGPFYYESSPARRDITEGRKGVRLRLGITVANATVVGAPCAPLADTVVDVWQTDADGIYSNVGTDLQMVDTRGQTFMRGHQVTNGEGYVEFNTVVPGWEIVAVPPPQSAFLRTTHIHLKIFREHKVATSQLYFPDDFLDRLYASVDPYKTHRKMTAPGLGRSFDRIRNGKDAIFLDDKSKPLEIRREGDGVFAHAMIGIVASGSHGVPSLFR
jgi:protocatechuate 3,4-dioxygenase beta subunit